MAHFYADIVGRAKTAATRCGTKKTGIRAHVRGWHSGVRVEASHIENTDVLTIYVTHGSGSSEPDKPIGFVCNTPGGPAFFDAGSSLFDSLFRPKASTRKAPRAASL